jgi:two-component sensor histidine kinase
MRSWRSWIAWLRQPPPARLQDGESKERLDSGGSLRLRLMVAVTLALTPIILASVVQGMDRARRDAADVRERLIQTARAASTSEENILAAAEQIARALANLPDVRDASPSCHQNLSDALRGVAFFTNISRVNSQGIIVCSALAAASGADLSAQPVWKEISSGDSFRVSAETARSGGDRRAMLGMLPLRDDSGRFMGAISIAIDVGWLDFVVRSSPLPRGSVVAIFDRYGRVLASNREEIANALFRHPGYRDDAEVYSADDSSGHTWTYATAALLGKNVFAGFAMRRASLFGATYLHVGTDFIVPFLMIALTWVAVWIATERQVTRWIVYLRRISGAYRSGHYAVRPALQGAPTEFQMLSTALSDMAESIQDRDRRLREALVQKSLLLREIHHRVKNNLQIVMSLLNLQAKQLQDSVAKDALRQSRARINALALVHKILHEIEDQSLVDLKPLLEDLTYQTSEAFAGDQLGIKIATDISSHPVPGDFAVPIALVTVEALTNVFKHAFPPGRLQDNTIWVTLVPVEAHRLRLAVEDNGVGFDSAPEENVGVRLIRTFAQQIGAVLTLNSSFGHGTRMELLFPDPATVPDQADTQPEIESGPLAQVG